MSLPNDFSWTGWGCVALVLWALAGFAVAMFIHGAKHWPQEYDEEEEEEENR
jgi:hypothetical protein